jgi:hypothetical protein
MSGTACFLERLAASSLPIATFFLSVAVGFIALLQWRVAHNKLRLDLFDRRYKVFAATREFLQTASSGNAEFGQFSLAIADAEFLFGGDVAKWLKELRKKAAHLKRTETLLTRPKDDQQLEKHADAELADRLWLVARADELTELFKPYLGFAKIK